MEIKSLSTIRQFTYFSAGLCVVILLLAPLDTWAAMYKCTDAKGQVEYRAIPRQDADCVDMRAPTKPPEDPKEKLQELRDKVDALNKAKAEQEAAKEKEDKRQSYCKVARSNLEILESEGEVARTDADGEKIKLDSEQRAAALNQTLKDIEYFCE